jgi:hypothetical protein
VASNRNANAHVHENGALSPRDGRWSGVRSLAAACHAGSECQEAPGRASADGRRSDARRQCPASCSTPPGGRVAPDGEESGRRARRTSRQ